MKDKEETFEHESYGMVGLSRCTGSARLFGSAIPRHGHFICLRVSEGERNHHLSRDWYRARKNLIEVWLSAAQFADMVTGMNMGEGVPCTIKRLHGKLLEEPPDLKTEAEKVQTDFSTDLQDLVTQLKGARKEIEGILEQKSIKVADRKTILARVNKMVQEIEANVPFVLQSFQEASDKVVTHAKAEVEAFTTARVIAAGVKAIGEQQELPALKEANEEKEKRDV